MSSTRVFRGATQRPSEGKKGHSCIMVREDSDGLPKKAFQKFGTFPNFGKKMATRFNRGPERREDADGFRASVVFSVSGG